MTAPLALLIPLLLYAVTLCPTTYVGDSGEMITIALTLGVPQPTGFPLYCLAGKVMSLWPGVDPAVAVNALSALSTAVCAWAIHRLLESRVGGSWALVGALTYATGHTPWSQATIARTYALTQAMLALQLVLIDRLHRRPRDRAFLALVLLASAGLGTHLLSILLTPTLVPLWWVQSSRRKGAAIGLFALGLGLYAYLPLRSATTPYNVYGPVHTTGEIVDYLTQRRYRTKQFSRSPENMRAAVAVMADHAQRQHGWPAVVTAALALGGLVVLRRRRDPLVAPMVLGSLFNVLILAGYGDNPDLPFLPRYFLFCWMVQACLATCGLAALVRRLGLDRTPTGSRVVATAVGLALVTSTVGVGSRCDRRRTTFPVRYARALITSPDSSALVFLSGDSPILMADYLHHVEKRGGTAHYLGLEVFESFRRGRPYPGPVSLTFVPRTLPPGRGLVHVGLTWQLVSTERGPTAEALTARRAAFWRDFPLDDVETDAALDDYEAAALAGEIFFHRGLDALEDGLPGEARRSFDKARRVSPDNRLLMRSLARVYAKAGWRDEARDLVERSIDLDLDLVGRRQEARTALHGELEL